MENKEYNEYFKYLIKAQKSPLLKDVLFYVVLWLFIALFLTFCLEETPEYAKVFVKICRDYFGYDTLSPPIIYSNVITSIAYCIVFRKNHFYLNVAFCLIMSLICLGLFVFIWLFILFGYFGYP
ncbi:MAG: hypothetical protein LBM93_07915 [Oscillospiraceae bacterium]|jgi:hypothetical protein|nr:hypothetical protein [Oscillospiraceae bacterium]